jgi:hypothetical protein
MAFFLPIIVGATSAASGFIVGYMFQSTPDSEETLIKINSKNLKNKIDEIKLLAPRKDVNVELENFDIKKLKKVESVEKIVKNEDAMFLLLKEKVKSYRKNVKPI